VTELLFCSRFPTELTPLKEKELKPIPSCESSHELFAGLQSITDGNPLKRIEGVWWCLLVRVFFFTGGNVEANYFAKKQNRKQSELGKLIRLNSPNLPVCYQNHFDMQLLK